MDFLRIRQKARERAAARAGGAGGPRAPEPPPRPSEEGRADAAPEVALVERALAERLDDPASPPAPFAPPLAPVGPVAPVGPRAEVEREGFTTWRPGSGAPPHVELEAPSAPGDVPIPGPEDFKVVVPPVAPPPAAADAPPRAASGPAAAPADPLREFFYREDEEAPPVPLAGRAEEAAPDDAETIAREEYLTFLLGREEYAVAIERVREVLKAPPVTEVPRAPAHVLGVVTVRGEVVAVFDPRRRLGLPGAPPEPGAGRIVIVEAGDGACGLLVDGVASVVRLRPGTIEACPQGIGGASADCLAGIGRQGDRLFTVLDLGALLRRPAAPARAAPGEDRVARP